MRKCEIKRNGELLLRASVADSFFLRLRGLLGRDPKSFGPLLIVPCSDIHTFFMSDTIDVVYLDKNDRVIKVDKSIAPGKACAPVRHARKVCELPTGFADELKIVSSEQWEVIY